MASRIVRGHVRLYRFAPPDKRRPVVVLTRDSAIAYLSTVTVAPISSTIRGVPSEVVLDEDLDGWGDFDDAPATEVIRGKEHNFQSSFFLGQTGRAPWLTLWQQAHKQLQGTKHIIVWGFSLPTTDVKRESSSSLVYRAL